MCSFVGLTAATQFSASEFLKKYETEVFEVVDPRLSLLRLFRKGVITENVRLNIYTSNTEDAREVLCHHVLNGVCISSTNIVQVFVIFLCGM